MTGPDVWGPHGWKFIHYITLGYPSYPTDKEKETYYNFFTLLGDVIPCSVCANNYKEHLKKTPLDKYALKNTQSLMEWGILMHNHVNAINGKKIYSFDEGIKAIIKNDDSLIHEKNIMKETFLNKKNKNKEHFLNNNTIVIILSISIIINIIALLIIVLRQ